MVINTEKRTNALPAVQYIFAAGQAIDTRRSRLKKILQDSAAQNARGAGQEDYLREGFKLHMP
jgi:hypothetical protein